LRGSWKAGGVYFADSDEASVDVFSGLPYALIHDRGGVIKPNQSQSPRNPQIMTTPTSLVVAIETFQALETCQQTRIDCYGSTRRPARSKTTRARSLTSCVGAFGCLQSITSAQRSRQHCPRFMRSLTVWLRTPSRKVPNNGNTSSQAHLEQSSNDLRGHHRRQWVQDHGDQGASTRSWLC